MTVASQRNLFSLPKAVHIELNHPQRAVLDWAAFNDGKLAVFPGKLSKQSLRTLIAKGVIERVGNPPRYSLTAIGWVVRGRSRGELFGPPPPLTVMLFHDDHDE